MILFQISIPYKRPRLRLGAVPSVFPNSVLQGVEEKIELDPAQEEIEVPKAKQEVEKIVEENVPESMNFLYTKIIFLKNREL